MTMRRRAILLLSVVLGTVMAVVVSPSAAQSANENVLVFSATGVFLKSYSEGDYTTQIDATDITYEEYAAGSPPTVSGGGTQAYTYSAGEYWIPNDLDGMYPAPPGGLPQVSLYSFDQSVLSFSTPGVPGITVSPASGTYSFTVDVLIQAYPSTAVVEIYNDDTASWETFGNSEHVLIAQTRTLRIRSDDGGTKSPEKTVTYEIDQAPDVDTDGDTIPDLIEILLGRFDPFVADADMDTDSSGWTDLDELLRGSDPDNTDSDGDGWSDADEDSMGTDRYDPADSPAGSPPVYVPPLEPTDTDGDSWPDSDEDWRQTDKNDSSDYPTARRLYEVETLASGKFNDVPSLPTGAYRRMKITENDNPIHVDQTLGSDNFSAVRWPRGDLSLIRMVIQTADFVDGATQISNTWSSRKMMGPLPDPSPADIPSASWYSGSKGPTDLLTDWFAAWEDLLANELLDEETDLQIDPEDTAVVALFETMFSYVGGLDPSASYLLGRDGNNPDPGVVQDVRDRLQNPVQVPEGATTEVQGFADLLDTYGQIQETIGAVTAVLDIYSDYTDGDDLEWEIAQTIRSTTWTFPAVLALSLTYDEMMATGIPLEDLLDDMADLEPDGLPNFVEALGYLNGWETNIFKEDTDGDEVPDPFDNCPTVDNPDQLDNDSDGFGDACDPDDDNDGMEDALEDLSMTDENEEDSDGDGWSDGDESAMGLDPNDPNDAVFDHANVPVDDMFASQSYPYSLGQEPKIFASITSHSQGITTQADLRNKTLSGFELRGESDPGDPATPGTETASYLVVDPLPSGWNGGTITASGNWQDIFFDFPYIPGETPLVFATIQSETDTTTFHVEVDEIGSASFRLRIRANAAVTPPGTIAEEVSWMAFLEGDEIPGGGESGDVVTGAAVETVSFDTPFTATPTLLVSVEGEGVHPVVDGLDSTGFDLFLATDFVAGASATDHRVSWVALGTLVCEDPDMDGVCSADDNAPDVYNPDQLDSDGDGYANIVEWLAGSDMFDANSIPTMTNAQGLIDLLDSDPTPQQLFDFAQMWMMDP